MLLCGPSATRRSSPSSTARRRSRHGHCRPCPLDGHLLRTAKAHGSLIQTSWPATRTTNGEHRPFQCSLRLNHRLTTPVASTARARHGESLRLLGPFEPGPPVSERRVTEAFVGRSPCHFGHRANDALPPSSAFGSRSQGGPGMPGCSGPLLLFRQQRLKGITEIDTIAQSVRRLYSAHEHAERQLA